MQSYWFGDIDQGRCTLSPGDTKDLAGRLAALHTDTRRFAVPAWEDLVRCGIPLNRHEYLDRLRALCFFLAETGIAERCESRDSELLQMVRTLDEIDDVANLLTERVLEWHRISNPAFSRKYQRIPRQKLLPMMKKRGSPAFRRILDEIEALADARSLLMKEVTRRSDEVLPNCSALIGGLVAARLVSRAGSLEALARLPGSSIQVLGARTALFSHMRGGTPPPKHGIIFQHRRVHNAGKEVRGKVARVLAAKLAIAARLDFYRKEPVPVFIAAAQERIDNAGGRSDDLD
jgi:nucleolar protein 56